MFGGDNSTNDITLDKIDYEWVESTDKIVRLKKALKLLEQDGSYYVDLIKAIEQKILSLDPKIKSAESIGNVSTNKSDNIIQNQDEQLMQALLKKQQADIEKNKGNQALKENDLQEALNYYTKSIQYDSSLAASYCNRALIYLKLNRYIECIKDCDETLVIDPKYIKAYHRRAKANYMMNSFSKAYKDYKYILKIQPDYPGIESELRDCCSHMTQNDIQMSDNAVAFKSVAQDQDQSDKKLDYKSLECFQKDLLSIDDLKQKATIEIKKGMYNVAIDILMNSLRLCWKVFEQLSNPNDITTIKVLRCSILSNIALCYMQSGENKRVIEYCDTLLEDESHLFNNRELVVKVYLRRALAFESLEKLIQSKLDFLRVKQLDPSNLQATKGLDRIMKIITQEENVHFMKLEILQRSQSDEIQKSQALQIQKSQSYSPLFASSTMGTKQNSENNQNVNINESEEDKGEIVQDMLSENNQQIDLRSLDEQLIEFKDKGNKLYKDKNIEDSILTFAKGEQLYESNLNPISQKESLVTYVQLLTNHCLCLSSLNRNQDVIELSNKVLQIDPNNLKANYRRALAILNIVDEKEKTPNDSLVFLEEVNDLLEKSRKDLERINFLQKENKQAVDKLKEVQHRNILYRLKINELKPAEVQPKNQSKKAYNRK